MSIQQDFVAYHESISSELQNSQNRIRDLIGDAHWLTDGEHKESILRKVIENFAPEIFRIGRGFVCYPSSQNANKKSSKQIDILITLKSKPTLYKDVDLHLVTADSVKAIIEVKTKLPTSKGNNYKSIVESLSESIKQIREIREKIENSNSSCWAGLFVYEPTTINHQRLLKILQEVTDGNEKAVINCIAIGQNKFIRYWENNPTQPSLEQYDKWHSYELPKLAHSYFISNLIAHLSDFAREIEEAWFPIFGSKEIHKKYYAKLTDTEVYRFERN